MTPQELLEILAVSEKLKCNTRHSWTSNGRQESIADHSYQLALMAFLLTDEYPDLDMDRVIRMCLVHDLGEAMTGDIPAFNKSGEDEAVEERVLAEWVNSFPEPAGTRVRSLLAEMQEQQTGEAKLYKALDKMEAVIQHDRADLATWLPLEYELQFAYGREQVQCSQYTKALKQEVDKLTEQRIQEAERANPFGHR